MIYNSSEIDKARSDTLLHKAEGEALTRLSQFYGFSRPFYLRESDWRSALHMATLCAQPTPQVVIGFVKKCLEQWTEVSTFEMITRSISTAEPIDPVDGNIEGRLVEINGKTYFLSFISAGRAHFSRVATSYWKGSDFGINETVQVKVLPFLVEEHNCEFKLIFDGGIFTIPSTYLQENGEDQEVGEPPFGYLMEYSSTNPDYKYGDAVDGAYPAYLASNFIERSFESSIGKLLSAGIHLTAENITWCEGLTSMYASFSSVLNGGSPSSSGQSTPTPDRT